MTQIQPVQDAHRIVLLDVLRGFAVLGILLANIPFMSMAAGLPGTLVPPQAHYVGGDGWLDHASHWFVYIFADTKFVTIFSTLFGAGLGLMSERALAAGAPFVGRYVRRLAILFLFGAAHVTLLWMGDILLVYSLFGFMAMWFRKRSVKTLLIWAGVLLTLCFLMWVAFGFADPIDFVKLEKGPDDQFLTIEQQCDKNRARIEATFSDGSFVEMMRLRIELYGSMLGFMFLVLGPRTLALFLFGIAVVKSGMLNVFVTQRSRLFRIAILGLGIGLPLQVTSLVYLHHFEETHARVIGWGSLYLAGLAIALGYASVFALWLHTNVLVGLRARLAAVGRMALTNYLSHSLITGVIFNYCGQFDAWRRPQLLLLVFGIFGVQLWISPIWLRHFHYGPMEWLWRVGTYARLVPIRRV